MYRFMMNNVFKRKLLQEYYGLIQFSRFWIYKRSKHGEREKIRSWRWGHCSLCLTMLDTGALPPMHLSAKSSSNISRSSKLYNRACGQLLKIPLCHAKFSIVQGEGRVPKTFFCCSNLNIFLTLGFWNSMWPKCKIPEQPLL